jgi:hypothetical protein
MKNIRIGNYALYKDLTFELNTKNNGYYELISRDDTINKYKDLGFIQYNKVVCYLIVLEKDVESAYYVDTFCKYKNIKCQVIDIKNNIILINPPMELQIILNDRAQHGYDPRLEVEEGDIEEIWEERTPIEGFKFDVEPIYYIKRK